MHHGASVINAVTRRLANARFSVRPAALKTHIPHVPPQKSSIDARPVQFFEVYGYDLSLSGKMPTGHGDITTHQEQMSVERYHTNEHFRQMGYMNVAFEASPITVSR